MGALEGELVHGTIMGVITRAVPKRGAAAITGGAIPEMCVVAVIMMAVMCNNFLHHPSLTSNTQMN